MSRARVFISYSERDKAWRDRLVEHLSPLVHGERMDVADIASVPPGAAFGEYLDQAIDGAKVGVFLVSSSFLASGFVREHELPRILRKHEEGGLVLLPVVVRSCAVELVKWLAHRQCLPRGGGAIARNDEAMEDALLTEVAREVAKHLPAESLVIPIAHAETVAPVEPPDPAPPVAVPSWPPPRALPGVLQLGSVFHGRYRVDQLIKAGGMGAVYEVHDSKTHNLCALKIMLPHLSSDPDFRARFGREAQVTGGIESDHLVRISDAGVDDATSIPFIVMELLRGKDLATKIAEDGPLDHASVVTYMHQTARALDKTHARRIVHRDLKPENLFLTHDDDDLARIKVLDFGIAKLLTSGGPITSRVLGTPLYMAPEQISPGKETTGPRADIYSLGHVAYTLLTGEAYWTQELQEGGISLLQLLPRIIAGAKESPVVRAARRQHIVLPTLLDDWFFKVTHPDPARRFETARLAVAELADALGLPGPTSLGAGMVSRRSASSYPPPAVAAEPTELLVPPRKLEGSSLPTLEAVTKKVAVSVRADTQSESGAAAAVHPPSDDPPDER